jgi:hypothetical protein
MLKAKGHARILKRRSITSQPTPDRASLRISGKFQEKETAQDEPHMIFMNLYPIRRGFDRRPWPHKVPHRQA